MEYFKSLFGKASVCEGSVVLAYPLGYVGRLNNLRPPHGIWHVLDTGSGK